MVYVEEQVLFDFSDPGACDGWKPVDDLVMGGCSRSRVMSENGALIFCGELSLEQGGGFASIRSPGHCHDISSGTALVIDARGDGHRYKLGLRISFGFDAPVYQAGFVPSEENFTPIVIPYGELLPYYHGRHLLDADRFDPRAVYSFGLLIADRQAGPFRLEVRRISSR